MSIVTDLEPHGTVTFHDARSAFRATVAEVAAKAKLPTQVNGRIESAVKLVLAYDVTPQADGTIEVGSSTDPLKVYHLVGATCDCQDFAHGKAPDGWCQHVRLVHYKLYAWQVGDGWEGRELPTNSITMRV